MASVPPYVTWTGRRYQPLASGGRDSDAPVTVGGVLSILIGTSIVTLMPSVALHTWLDPFVSSTTVVSAQPVSGSVAPTTVQSIDTGDRYQPVQLSGAGAQS